MTPAHASRRMVMGAAASALCAGAVGCAAPGLHYRTPRPVALDELTLVADGLDRPEGIVATRDGRVIVSCASAACTVIAPDGARRSVGSAPHANGIAMDREGRIIVANYGLLDGVPGSLQRVDLTTGLTLTLADAIEGRRLTSSNFPAIGPDGEIYCSHMQWEDPRNIGATNPAGFVYRVRADGRVERVVDGLRMANGICFSAGFEHLFVAQTAAASVLRYARRADGSYGDPQQWGPQLGDAPDNIRSEVIFAMTDGDRNRLGHVDGLALDRVGNLWVTQPFANRVVVVTPLGETIVVVSDPSREKLDMTTSIAFGGRDLRDLYISSMRRNSVWKVRVDTPGLPLPHW